MTQKFTPTVKHNSPWVVLLLGVVTLGIYSYAWVSRRYEESTAKPEKMSHWVIPICIILLAILLGMVLMVVIPLTVEAVDVAAAISVYGNYGLLCIAQILGAWWTVRFALRLSAIHKTTARPLPVLLMAFFFSPILLWYLQRQLNDRQAEEEPYVRLLASIVAVVLGVATFTVAYLAYPAGQEIESLEIEYRVTREYIACHEELEAAYPGDELSDDDFEAYLDGFDDCEAITDEDDW